MVDLIEDLEYVLSAHLSHLAIINDPIDDGLLDFVYTLTEVNSDGLPKRLISKERKVIKKLRSLTPEERLKVVKLASRQKEKVNILFSDSQDELYLNLKTQFDIWLTRWDKQLMYPFPLIATQRSNGLTTVLKSLELGIGYLSDIFEVDATTWDIMASKSYKHTLTEIKNYTGNVIHLKGLESLTTASSGWEQHVVSEILQFLSTTDKFVIGSGYFKKTEITCDDVYIESHQRRGLVKIIRDCFHTVPLELQEVGKESRSIAKTFGVDFEFKNFKELAELILDSHMDRV